MQADSGNNIWRTIVLTSAGGILGFFIVRFLFGASSDMQGFVIGIGFGALGGSVVGWFAGLWHSHAHRDQQAVADAYARGRQDGFNDGYRRGLLQQDGMVEAIVPTQTCELVRAGRGQ